MKFKKGKMVNFGVDKVGDKFGLSRAKKSMVKLYLKSPPKVQYALAKFGVKTVVNKKKAEIEELIRH